MATFAPVREGTAATETTAGVVEAPHSAALAIAARALALWHLSSLDAPLVAVVWTAFLARLGGISLPPSAYAALFVAVWIIYATDRLLDGRRSTGEPLQERHRFHQSHTRALLLTLLVAVPALTLLVAVLPSPLRLAWPLLSLPVALYAAAVHLLSWPRLPKELLVSVLFTAACVTPAVVLAPATPADPAAPVATAAAAVAMLLGCLVNSWLITRWEGGLPRLSPLQLLQSPGATPRLAFATGVSLLLPVLLLAAPLAACATLLSIAALAWLHRQRRRLPAVHLRALADVALLTPLLLLPCLHTHVHTARAQPRIALLRRR